MIPISPVFFSRAPAGTLPFDIFDFTPGSLNFTNGACRNIVYGFPSGGSKLRVYMAAILGLDGVVTQFKAAKVGVGRLITGTYSQPSTQAVPVEITFNGGQHGFGASTASPALNPGQMVESDEIAFTFTPSDKLVFCIDGMSGPSFTCAAAHGIPNSELWARGSVSMAQSTVTGFINQGSIANAAAFIRIGAR